MTTEPAGTAAAAGPGAGDAQQPPAADQGSVPARVRVASPASLLAVVPLLLRFRPAASLVVIGTELPVSAVQVTLRYDLPGQSDPVTAGRLAREALGKLACAGAHAAFAVGYGPDELVAPLAAALRAAATDVKVVEILRAEHGLYWSYVCTDPGCCPPEGTPYRDDDSAARIAAAAAFPGVQVLESREELAATVAPAKGTATAMRRATSQAERQLRDLTWQARSEAGPLAAARTIARPGLVAVGEAIARYRDGAEPLPRAAAARLTVALRSLRVRDDAWARMEPEHRDAHRRLWTDLTRLARPGYVAAPASLLAFVAWQDGDGALANVALDRALADNPRYSMAHLLRDALDSGAPPSMAAPPMTPEEVAAAYDALEALEAPAPDACGTAPCAQPDEQAAEPAPAMT